MEWLSLLLQIIVCLHVLLFDFPSLCFSAAASHSLCHPDQSTSLLQFKSSFIITTTMFRCDEDEPLKMATWKNGTNCCSWLGVTCDTISGNVIGLNLSCEGLQGTINPNSTLFQLSHLQTLILSSNDYLSSSQLPSQFGGFRSLEYLDLSWTGIQGEIASEISHLSKLVSLDLSMTDGLKWKELTLKRLLQNATSLRELVLDDTDMSSIKTSTMSLILNISTSLITLSLASTRLSENLTIDILCPPNLQKLDLSFNVNLQGQLPRLTCGASLSVLDLSNCKFEGQIPPSFSNLTRLTYVSLSWNNLNGSIPSSLLTLPRLTSLYLSHNALSGRIPNVFQQSNRLQELDLTNNNIGGLFPSSLSQLQHLIRLDLSFNTFSGPVSNVFGGLTKLEEFHLNNNNLGGEIPSSMFDLTHLYYLDCSHNKLEGSLPNQITGLLPNLTELHLHNNFLNGTIPLWCLSLPSLTYLDLSNNQFSGHLSAISSYSLETLYLCSNKLQGNIPESIFNLGNLTVLCLSSNNWSGPVDFQLFSKLQNLYHLYLSQNSQLSLNFESSVNYSFPRLTTLELSDVGLKEFPNLLGKFPSLGYLDLSNNKLEGIVPDWLYELDSLTFLNMSRNLLTSIHRLSRNLLTSIHRLPRHDGLTGLDLSFNLLSGDISLFVCHSSISLEVLNLSHNNLTGIIPQCLAKLLALQVLDLQMNKLHGTLPAIFPKNKRLRTLNLNGNQIEGPLSESLSNCTQLQVLDLGHNQIEGTFPYWLQTLPFLKVLVLRANKLEGPIASLKSKLVFPSLIIFDISSNNFNGPIPKAYIQNFEAMKNVVQANMNGGLQYLQQDFDEYSRYNSYEFYDYVDVTLKGNSLTLVKIPTTFVNIDLSMNNFEGEIPDDIGELQALKGLNLSHNRLIDAIPRSIGNLTNLESLDLSSNMLSGEIPTELTNLNYLEVLDLSYNHLVGEIPQGKQFNTFSNDSYVGNLGLCGFPLSNQCNPRQYSPPSRTLWREEKFEFGWKPVAIGYGCGMVFGIGLGCLVLLIGKPQWLVPMVGGEPSKRVKRRTRIRMRTHGKMNQ